MALYFLESKNEKRTENQSSLRSHYSYIAQCNRYKGYFCIFLRLETIIPTRPNKNSPKIEGSGTCKLLQR